MGAVDFIRSDVHICVPIPASVVSGSASGESLSSQRSATGKLWRWSFWVVLPLLGGATAQALLGCAKARGSSRNPPKEEVGRDVLLSRKYYDSTGRGEPSAPTMC